MLIANSEPYLLIMQALGFHLLLPPKTRFRYGEFKNCAPDGKSAGTHEPRSPKAFTDFRILKASEISSNRRVESLDFRLFAPFGKEPFSIFSDFRILKECLSFQQCLNFL